ncbi:MAG: thermostable hemolysin [Pseudohongiellaceae bacterium]
MNAISRPATASSLADEPERGQALRQQRDSLLRRTLSPGPRFDLLSPRDAQRAEAEQYVAERYQAAYHAELHHFLPCLMTMRCLGTLSGVAGMGPAGAAPLFLERYLNAPVEQVLSALGGTQVARADLVEIGNLAADQRGASHLLFVLFSAVLHRAGYRWMTFTATRALRNNLHKLGFPLLNLGSARIEEIPADERASWGSYYDTDPQVVAGSLDAAFRIIQERPLMRRVLRLYRYEINYLAEGLKRS